MQCGKCTKCVRTQLDLLVAGENPREWGFPSFDEKKFSRLVSSYWYFDNSPGKYWDIMDAIEDGKEYPCCNEMLHWLKGVGWREYFKRAQRRRKLALAMRVFKVWRYPHYVAVVFHRMGLHK